jgi:hypothetical protein
VSELYELALLLMTQVEPQAVPSGPPIPTWGWITIVAALAGTVATLGGLYKGAKNETIKAKDETIGRADAERERTKETNEKLTALLERAIEAFNSSKVSAEQLSEKHDLLISELKELKVGVQGIRDLSATTDATKQTVDQLVRMHEDPDSKFSTVRCKGVPDQLSSVLMRLDALANEMRRT